jgi:hypothetical protein
MSGCRSLNECEYTEHCSTSVARSKGYDEGVAATLETGVRMIKSVGRTDCLYADLSGAQI